jgi:hypothetical protein
MGKKSGKKNHKKPVVAAQSPATTPAGEKQPTTPTTCLWECDIEGCPCDGDGFLSKCSQCSECVGGLKHLLMFITRREEDGKFFTVLPRGNTVAEFNNVFGFPCITLWADTREDDLLRVKGIWEQLKAGADGDKVNEYGFMYVDI